MSSAVEAIKWGASREMFRRGTFTQDVVHNHLWITVDMWKRGAAGSQVSSVSIDDIAVHTPERENHRNQVC